MLCVCIPISRIGRIKRARSAREDSSKYIRKVQAPGSGVPNTLPRRRDRGLRMRQGSLGRHPGGLQKASGSSLPSDGLRWASDGPPMGLRWASDGSRMELGWVSESFRWVSDGQQKGSRMFKMKLLWSPTNPRTLHFSRIGVRYASLMVSSVSR